MNISKVERYDVGLDLGTGSVGWAVIDHDTGEICHVKGKPMLGSRIFKSADSAADTRMARGQRRRYVRRRQRIDALQGVFAEEIAKVDPEFFIRLNVARLLREDRGGKGLSSIDYRHTFFADDDPAKKEYCRYKTVWHLRHALMTSNEKADVRFIYLAMHNIVKHRGNFLHEDEGSRLKAANADANQAVHSMIDALRAKFEHDDEAFDSGEETSSVVGFDPDASAMKRAIEDNSLSRGQRADELKLAFGISGDAKLAKNLARACFDYKVDFSNIFEDIEKSTATDFNLGNDEKVQDFIDSICTDEAKPLFTALQQMHSAFILCNILQGNASLSEAFIEQYEQHKSDLAVVKTLVRRHFGKDAYDEIFRGPLDGNGDYDINKLPDKSYTAYIAGEKKANGKGCSYEVFVKSLKKRLMENEDVLSDTLYEKIRDRFESDENSFLAKQKTRANGAIPYQLHLEELLAIIDKQARYYPFLEKNRELFKKIVSSRIPYYVGPLNTSRDPLGEYPNNKIDGTRKFAWSVRRPGTEGVKVYPWNITDIIDLDTTAERFIRRMTGTCTYIYGEPVLPKCSLLYEEFCVLNELNGSRYAVESGEFHRFDARFRAEILEDLFKKRKSVSHRAVVEWLKRNKGFTDVRISGTQAESSYESKLNSYNDFCNILSVESLEEQDVLKLDSIEEIILWNTVFEDRDILKRKIEEKYGNVLSKDQIARIVRKRYTGWGRLSQKFLDGVTTFSPLGNKTIMDVLREGNPFAGSRRETMILQEVMTFDEFDFGSKIQQINLEHLSEKDSFSLDEMPGSPALRRTVNQALRIVAEIVSVAGKPPCNICIEETRGDDKRSNRGKRTSSRYEKIKQALEAFKNDIGSIDPELMRELNLHKDMLDDKRLALYFMQQGKCLYSGKPLDINRLQDYQIDHILPQSYIKDDSFDNMALVLAGENQRKLDSMLLEESVIWRNKQWWTELHRAGLVSKKKINNLMRTEVNDRQLRGFLNRQLVETSQVIKFVRTLCEKLYPNTHMTTIRASLSHDLREQYGFIKCRTINNYHHAHDAYLACQIGRFIEIRYPKWQEGFDLALIRKFVKRQSNEFKKTGKLVGESGIIVNGFKWDAYDADTGEVFWRGDEEIERIRRVLGYKKIFITRMIEEQTGAFWDETVYSPKDARNGKNLPVPLKESGLEGCLDPFKYGGHQNVKQAYFFIFVAIDKKGKKKAFFEGVPVYMARQIGYRNRGRLQSYAEEIAEKAGCTEATILREKVCIGQRFILDGIEYYLGGKTNSNNDTRLARELCPPEEIIRSFINLSIDSNRTAVFDWICQEMSVSYERLYRLFKLDSSRDAFRVMSEEGQSALISRLMEKLAGNAATVDLSGIGGVKQAGAEFKSMASSMQRIIWIDQSVTGIFEKRTTYRSALE